MSEHASNLVLDELAAGLEAPAGTKAHVEACAECSARLQTLKAARVSSQEAFGYSRVKARLAPEARAGRRWLIAVPLFAVALALFVAVPPLLQSNTDTERLKGAAFVELLSGGQVVHQAMAGGKLQLRVGTAGKAHGAVVAVSQDGSVAQLWAGAFSSRGVVTLPMELEVTPGSVTVHAFVSDAPLEPSQVLDAVKAAVTKHAASPLDAPPPLVEGAQVVTARLEVKG